MGRKRKNAAEENSEPALLEEPAAEPAAEAVTEAVNETATVDAAADPVVGENAAAADSDPPPGPPPGPPSDPASDSPADPPAVADHGSSEIHSPATTASYGYDPAAWLRSIQQRNQMVSQALQELESAKRILKFKREFHDSAVAALCDLIQSHKDALEAHNRPLPLFDGSHSSNGATANGATANGQANPVMVLPGAGDGAPASTDAWRDESINALNLPGSLPAKLQDEGITTIGELEDKRASRGGLSAIKGIGEKKITLIEDAVIDWLSKNRDGKALAAAAAVSSVDAAAAVSSVDAATAVAVAVDATESNGDSDVGDDDLDI